MNGIGSHTSALKMTSASGLLYYLRMKMEVFPLLMTAATSVASQSRMVSRLIESLHGPSIQGRILRHFSMRPSSGTLLQLTNGRLRDPRQLKP